MGHYTKEELDMYRHHEMSILRRIACGEHLKKCPECAKLMSELEEDDALIKELRSSIAAFAAIEQQYIRKNTAR